MTALFPILETLLKCALWYSQQLLCFDFSFISLIVVKSVPSIGSFSFGKRKKVSTSSSPVNTGDYGFVFGHKLTHKHQYASWCVIMVQNPWLVFPQFFAFLTNCFAQSSHNFKVVFLIDRIGSCGKNSWCTMPLQFKKTVSKTFTFERIWGAFFRSWLFCMLPLE